MTDYGYTPVPGSADLATQRRGSDPAVRELEALDPLSPAGREVRGEWLARAVVRSAFVPVLNDVFDRLMPGQEPEEAAVYLQLYRLSYGEERNWVRVARRELQERTGLSDRRLGGALAGLVAKDHVRLVHRDRQGTLYRVRLPYEVFGEADRDQVLVSRAPAHTQKGYVSDRVSYRHPNKHSEGSAAPKEKASAPAPEPERRPPPRAPIATAAAPGSAGELAARFVAAYGGKARPQVEVLEEVLGRLEEGRTLAEVAEELERFGRQAPKSTPVTELARWLARQR